jgi:hypothetical protein
VGHKRFWIALSIDEVQGRVEYISAHDDRNSCIDLTAIVTPPHPKLDNRIQQHVELLFTKKTQQF